MSSQPNRSHDITSADLIEVHALYHQLLDSWNIRDAGRFSILFEDNGNSIGFDGSQMNNRLEIATQVLRIFGDHQTASYVGKIREVRFLTPEVAILRAIAGMVPPGQSDINPAVNVVQTVVAIKRKGKWRIALFQNTPAQFHGRPELSEAFTAELRQLLKGE